MATTRAATLLSSGTIWLMLNASTPAGTPVLPIGRSCGETSRTTSTTICVGGNGVGSVKSKAENLGRVVRAARKRTPGIGNVGGEGRQRDAPLRPVPR